MRRLSIVMIVAVLVAVFMIALFVSIGLLVSQLPGVPQGVSATPDIWQTTINWSDVPGAKSYSIYWSTTPSVTKANGTKIEVSDPPYVHQDLSNNVTYYYRVAAVNSNGEGDLSNEVSVTTRLPKITGTATLPDLDVKYVNGLPGGGLYGIFLLDLSYNMLANETDASTLANNSFDFSVQANKAYILTAVYNGGQAISALTPTVVDDVVQNVSVDTEVAMDLIVATEHAMANLEPASLSRPLDKLLVDANQEVAYLNAFYEDRNNNRNADRIADAVRALTMDKLNQGSSVSVTDLNEATIRAYGGGLQGICSLSDMLSNPETPLNPEFAFTRFNHNDQYDFGMSDLKNKRWDEIGADGWYPDITTGGTKIVFVGGSGVYNSSAALSICKETLTSTGNGSVTVLTPPDLYCEMPSWSPDETKIAFSGVLEADVITQPLNIFVVDADGSNLKQLTHFTGPLANPNASDSQGAMWPSWSPDGSEIIFSTYYSTINSTGGISWFSRLEKINADGTNQRTFFDWSSTGYDGILCPSWSPDGSRIVFCASPPGDENEEIIVASNDFKLGDNVTILTANAGNNWFPSWSCDGRFIIFSSDQKNESGTPTGGGSLLEPFYVINSYTGASVVDFGDFASAGNYFRPRFTETEAVLSAVQGAPRDSSGNVIINPGSDARVNDSHNINSYYQVIIPAANQMGIDFSLPSWDGP